MEEKNEKTVSVLSELAEFVKDGKVGYKKAADESKDAEISSFCQKESDLRGTFLNELNSIIIQKGGDPEKGGTIKGKLYHQWMDVKATLTANDEEAIINSCIFGEEWAIKAYHNALESKDLPFEIRSVVEKQLQKCNEALGQLKKLKALHHH